MAGMSPSREVSLAIGDMVAVRADDPGRHHRTPWFVKGKIGRIAAVNGPFFNPESRAHGGNGCPQRLLYSVVFRQIDIWGERYGEDGLDSLLVDLYEHWLEPVAE